MRYYLVTLGCPKNTVDSEMMAQLLKQDGHISVDDNHQADVLIVNTCAFIADARSESLATLRELARHKRHGQRLVVAGCMAEGDTAEIRRRVPAVDHFIGTRAWPHIRQLMAQLQGGSAVAEPTEVADRLLVTSVTRAKQEGASAYLKIADGCDAACGYCAIPLIKGPQHSKQPSEVMREAHELAAGGVREINLIAQDTTAYGRDLGLTDALPGLISDLATELPLLLWLRILYAYPQHITQRLVDRMAAFPAVCHYLDIPLQHGSPAVLHRMRRPDDIDHIWGLIVSLRAAIPDIALRSTFIVGYPGETEHEFGQLIEFLQEARFDNVGVFRYSREKGTYAASLPDQVPAEVIESRYHRAMTAQQVISLHNNRAQVGRRLPMLVEGAADGVIVGRCYRQAPEIDGLTLAQGEATAGEVLKVEIVGAQEYDLQAVILAV